jgi:hypothetical protein
MSDGTEAGVNTREVLSHGLTPKAWLSLTRWRGKETALGKSVDDDTLAVKETPRQDTMQAVVAHSFVADSFFQ